MDTHLLLVAVLVTLSAAGVVLLVRWAVALAEKDFRADARLDKGDFDIGPWPKSVKGSRFPSVR